MQAVRVLDQTGQLLALPFDVPLMFARFLARSSVDAFRRFSITTVGPGASSPLSRTTHSLLARLLAGVPQVMRQRVGSGQQERAVEAAFDIVERFVTSSASLHRARSPSLACALAPPRNTSAPSSGLSDAEVIKAAADVLEQLPSVAAADCQIQIGHARMLEAVLALCHVDPNHRADLIHYVAELPKVPSSHWPPSPEASRGDRKKLTSTDH